MPLPALFRASALALVAVAFGVASTDARAAGLALDKVVTTNQSTAAKTVVSPALTTSAPNELLVAFIGSSGPTASGGASFSGVTGGGVAWTLRRRTNVQYGTSEIWTAVAPQPLSAQKITATRLTGSYNGSISVAAFTGADTSALGATGTGNASTGAPAAALTTTRAGSWVWGVGNDWDRAAARTVGAGQTKVAEYLASAGDTFWVQRETDPTPGAGTAVTLNDTAPANDQWNLATIEILPAAVDAAPPSAPTGLQAGTVTAAKVDLTWTASTDDVGVTGYRVYRDGAQVGTASGTSYSDTTVAGGSSYAYTVKAVDGVGNLSAASNLVTVTTPAPDTHPPSVVIASPAAGATLSGTTTVTAQATDDVGVAGVQFLLDGRALGAEDTASPYAASWDTTTATSGSHTLTARARDAAGNVSTSPAVDVTVSNSTSDPAKSGSGGP